MLNELGITRGEVLRYTFMPQILPRVRKLLTSPFYNLPYFIVAIFNMLRIIPNGHPYLRAENHGKYSLFSALSVAANNIEFNRKNIDKIAVFTLVLSGIVMFVLQMVLLVFAIFTARAYAYNGPGPGPTSLAGFFDNANTKEDLAFRLLDLIFGVPGIFNSANMGTTPFHQGLHALFAFYSYGILLIGIFVIIYLVMCIVMETAQSGIPFGQRFNKAWAPIRLVLFFALLIPTASGLNLAQYLLLNAAKLGSNLATNAWLTFDNSVKNAYISPEQLVASPMAPDVYDLLTFMAVARTCSWTEGRVNGRDIKPYFVYGPGAAGSKDVSTNMPAMTDLVKDANGGTLTFIYGEKDENAYPDMAGAVFPYCGIVNVSLVDFSQPGAALMQRAYVEMLQCLWDDAGYSGTVFNCPVPSFEKEARTYTARYSQILPHEPFPKSPDISLFLDDKIKLESLALLLESLDEAIKDAVEEQAQNGDWNKDAAAQLGWAGAGIWFNKIAEQNGALTGAVMAKPVISTMPYVMEYIKKQKLKTDSRVPLMEMYTPILSSGKSIMFETPQQREVALVLNQIYKYWGDSNSTAQFTETSAGTVVERPETTGNAILDGMNLVMGTRGLFNMCANTNVHPLAQLSAIGKGLINHSIGAFAIATGVGLTSGLLAFLEDQGFSQALMSATKFLITFAGIGLVAGFVMYYVIPFMPFIYFFFAVMTWAKGIFEAMVGMPLWALAHLKIDGEGMPGDLAASGYFYIFEVFLRPVCILIGFLGGIVIFGAVVKVLNEIFYLVIANVTGHHAVSTTNCFQSPAGATTGSPPAGSSLEAFRRDTIDQFFYTVVYAIIVFMAAGPCFKLVDLIPDNITRWMQLGIRSFGAQDGDPAQNMTRNITAGAGMIGGKFQEGFAGLEGSVKQGIAQQAAAKKAAAEAEG